MKNELNVFHYGYYSHKPKYWFSNVKQFFTNIKYAYQRATKGFCTWDRWGLDTYYSYTISTSLKELSVEVSTLFDEYKNSTDNWSDRLNEIANCIDSYLNYGDEEKLQKGLDMLKEDWKYLWD